MGGIAAALGGAAGGGGIAGALGGFGEGAAGLAKGLAGGTRLGQMAGGINSFQNPAATASPVAPQGIGGFMPPAGSPVGGGQGAFPNRGIPTAGVAPGTPLGETISQMQGQPEAQQPGFVGRGEGVPDEPESFWGGVKDYILSEQGQDLLGSLGNVQVQAGTSSVGPMRFNPTQVALGQNVGLGGLGQLAGSFGGQ